MIMVKLKMRKIYKAFLSFIGFLIMVAIALGVLYLFYDKVIEIDSDIEVAGNLSINYIDGKRFEVNDSKTIKFSVSNSSDNISYYNIGFIKVRGNGDYKLFSNESVVAEGELKSIDEITTDYISIDAKETKIFELKINNTGTDILKGSINLHIQEGKIETFANTIIKNVSVSENSLTKVGTEKAIENEGLIKSSDDVGVSYYFRGNVNNNYVLFGDMTWRIVRINGDGTVRLVLDGVTDVISSYYSSENKIFSYEESEMNIYLENWLQENLEDFIDYIANSKFCSDINFDDNYNFASYARIMTNQIPTFNCLGNAFNNSIGLLTVDEVVLAGAIPTDVNQNYYLYNSKIEDSWYTMTGASGSENNINMFMVDSDGRIRTDISGNLYRNVRPVINLIKNLEMEGTGTIEDPYRLKK